MKLCAVPKIGVFLDAVTHATERRPAGEVKVLVLRCRVQPFDAKLAGAVADVVRQTLFKLSTAEEQPHLERVQFRLNVPRQQLHVFAAPDTTQASLMFDQVKIGGTYARTEKDVNGYAFCFNATFGPPSKQELEYAEEWRLGQRCVTCEVAEPGLFDDDEEEPTVAPGREPDMWEEGEEQNPHAAATSAAELVDAAEAEGDPPSDREPARRTPRRGGRKPNGRAGVEA